VKRAAGGTATEMSDAGHSLTSTALTKAAAAHFMGSVLFSVIAPGVPLRYTPGFMLPPASRVWETPYQGPNRLPYRCRISGESVSSAMIKRIERAV
jgi:hypothetical protein